MSFYTINLKKLEKNLNFFNFRGNKSGYRKKWRFVESLNCIEMYLIENFVFAFLFII
ncbi:hypothetical protein BpHYR1_051724 [Brachionus plicatilis]|uniref:Uncharacterized protein n=1 Tax=Brachionus plicatilis TaxID=10195 RepID=A0A3M7PM82_BRAPC|nr:hypothetical protein BpHYR1_051724 [Brachionus plicatilis]